MSNPVAEGHNYQWAEWEKILFRFFFAFVFLLSVPLYDYHFYRTLFTIKWQVHDLLVIARYLPQFIPADQLPAWGIGSFGNIGVALLLSVLIAVIWGYVDKTRKDYQQLYYLSRVVARYRLAFALIAYGFVKLLPMQIPYPSLSNLYTNYGDFFAWKIYFHTLGIVPWYESFLGSVEILAGLLLLYRKTATIGAGITLGFIGNVAVANLAYDIGEHVFSTFLLLLAAFVISFDAPRLFRLLILRKKALASRFSPSFPGNWFPKLRRALQASFALLIVFLVVRSYTAYTAAPYLVPHQPGLRGAYGFYHVKQFVLNRDTIPYAVTDTIRWQDVVFERWATLSIRTRQPVQADASNGDLAFDPVTGESKYESAGNAGRVYYHYTTDTLTGTLALQNGPKKLWLQYRWQNDSTLLLSGVNNNSDSIHALLQRSSKKHLLLQGRRSDIKF